MSGRIIPSAGEIAGGALLYGVFSAIGETVMFAIRHPFITTAFVLGMWMYIGHEDNVGHYDVHVTEYAQMTIDQISERIHPLSCDIGDLTDSGSCLYEVSGQNMTVTFDASHHVTGIEISDIPSWLKYPTEDDHKAITDLLSHEGIKGYYRPSSMTMDQIVWTNIPHFSRVVLTSNREMQPDRWTFTR
jgi:hypothetical protein